MFASEPNQLLFLILFTSLSFCPQFWKHRREWHNLAADQCHSTARPLNKLVGPTQTLSLSLHLLLLCLSPDHCVALSICLSVIPSSTYFAAYPVHFLLKLFFLLLSLNLPLKSEKISTNLPWLGYSSRSWRRKKKTKTRSAIWTRAGNKWLRSIKNKQGKKKEKNEQVKEWIANFCSCQVFLEGSSWGKAVSAEGLWQQCMCVRGDGWRGHSTEPDYFSFTSTSNKYDSACKDMKKRWLWFQVLFTYISSRGLFKMLACKFSTCYSLLAVLRMEYDLYKFWRINIVSINDYYLCFVWGDLCRWNTPHH